MTALIKYAEHPKSPLRMIYVRLDARLDPIFNANKAERLNEYIFTYFTYKKTKIRCKVVISMVFNENQELDYIFWNNEYSFLNIVIHFTLRLGNFIFVIYTSVFGVYVAICLINGSHFYVRILKIQLKKSKIVGNLGRKYKSHYQSV